MRGHDMREKLICLNTYLCDADNTAYRDDAWLRFCNIGHAARIEITMADMGGVIKRHPHLSSLVTLLREDMISKVQQNPAPGLQCGDDDIAALEEQACKSARTSFP